MFTVTETNLSIAAVQTGRTPDGVHCSDEALIAAIAEGDRRAMSLLYGRHSARVYRFVVRLTGDPALAEDAVSDVFLDVWRQAGRFEARSQVSTWLLAIARNKGLSAVRRRVDEPLDDRQAAAIEGHADDPEAAVGSRERHAVMQDCLSKLPAAQREVIDLVYYHEKSVDEVARIVGAPANTVKTRMFYARLRLKELCKAAGIDAV